MSTAVTPSSSDFAAFPELTPLGKQLEVLRIGRGISKQYLARFAGTSRQQLWRVMTGKSELTDTLRQRLALALGVDASVLSADGSATTSMMSGTFADLHLGQFVESVSLEAYLAAPECVERTLRTLPNGSAGCELKRTLLNALEEQALRREITLPPAVFELRRKVVAGEL